MPEHLPIGTLTFLFTDLEGSTRLLQGLGADYPVVLERHAAILRTALSEHEGVEVSTEGDSFFAVFRSAGDALRAAVAAQRGLAEERWPAGKPVRVRMGLHTGEGRLGGDDYVGLDVHRAARIAAAANGGQVLLSAATRALVEGELPEGLLLRDLGSHRLKDLDRPEQLSQLVIPGLPEDFPAVRSLESPSTLPHEPTSFVGRQREVEAAKRLMATTRLLTLTGPGGTGKTRLALRIAAGLRSAFPDGVFFVDLAPLTEPDLVGPSIARSLGLSDQAERPIMDLLEAHLESRQALLVLDNFEHLLPAAEMVDSLLAAAPRVKALVTSRGVLQLYGEQEFEVPPLGLPDASASVGLVRIGQFESVALFVERARAVRPAFAVTDDNARAVVGICRRLDGLPLAIELAASRIRLLEPAEILSRLERHLTLLTGAGNLPARQRTLLGTIEWSYELLEPAERELFARLAIFTGGFSIEAAELICNPNGELGVDTLDGIAALVGQSLVRRQPETAESRFVMLETIRQYGRDRLQTDGRLDEMAWRHLEYFRDLAETAEPHFMDAEQPTWLDRFEREHDNVRVALRRALDAGDLENGLRLAAALWRFWFQRGYLREGRGWLEELLAAEPENPSAARAKGYTALGGLAYWLSDVEATEAAYASAVRLYNAIGDRESEAEALYNLAFVPVLRHDSEEGRLRFEASLALARELGLADLVAKVQLSMGITAVVSEDPQAALTLFEEGLTYFRAVGDQFHIADALTGVAQAHRLLGQYRAGRDAYLEALSLFTEARNLPGIGMTLQEIAALESAAGRHLEAIRLMGAADALREATGASAPLTLMRMGDVEADAREAIGDDAVQKALSDGRRMSLDEAVEYAVSLGS